MAPFATTGSLAAQTPAPTQWYGTHDWTATMQEQVFAEGWVDSKSPGDGRVGQARYELPIPDVRALVGLRFHNQAIVLDGAANAGGAVVSAAAEGVIGYR